MARSVGLPGVIAHGMYTMALAARAVADWFPGAEVVEPRLQVHRTRSSSRPRAASRSRSPARPRSRRRRADHGRAHRHLRRAEGARHAQGRRPCLLRWQSCSPTTPRCGSAVRPATGCEPRPSRSSPKPSPRPTRRVPCWCSAAAATSSSPTRASTGPSSRSPRAASRADHDGDDATCGGVLVTVAAGEEWDDVRGPRRRARLGRRRGAGRHPRPGRRDADPERRRLRPGGRPDHRAGSGSGTACSRASARSPTPTAGSATAPRGSRPTGGREAARRPGRHLPAASGRSAPRSQYAELARTLGVELGRARPARRGPRRRPRAAPRQGDGPRPGRPRHLERRLVLHQPGRRRRPTCREGAPAWPQADGRVKTSAAWLIERAGFTKGHGDGAGRAVRRSTPSRSPTAAAPPPSELLALAREVRDGVEAALRHPAGQRAGARRLRALTRPAPVMVTTASGRHRSAAASGRRREPRTRAPTSAPARRAARR